MESGTVERYASGAEAPAPDHDNLYEAFLAQVERLGDGIALRSAEEDVELSWNDLAKRVAAIAGGLNRLGLKKGETLALMLNNRSEFIPCDLGAVALGGIPFSIYQTSSPEQIEYVCSDAEARIA